MRGYCGIGLDNPKSGVNVGGALRACGIYGASFITSSGNRWKEGDGGENGSFRKTDTMKAYRHTPYFHGVADVMAMVPFDCVPVAVDIIQGARPLQDYTHPERAFYIFGAEDATLGARITDKCRDIIYIPTDGCMNLAATVNVVLYDRLAKQLRRTKNEQL